MTPPASPDQVRTVVSTRRNAELGLMVLAWIVGAAAFTSVDLATQHSRSDLLPMLLLVSAAVGVCAHLLVRWRAPYAEPVLLPTVYLLNLLGLTMIYRLDIAAALRAAGNESPEPSPVALSQLAWLVVAVVAFAATLLIVRDHRSLQRFTYISLFGGLILLLLPLVPGLGLTINGASLWIRIGPMSFQPGELAKILLAIFMAGFLVTSRDMLSLVRRRFLGIAVPRGRDMAPILIAWFVALAIMVFETDLGTAAVFFGLFVCMLYAATGRRSWLVISAILVAVGGTLAYFAFGHVRTRVQIWLDPFADADGAGYQIVQSMYGLANGGMFGTGLGQGYPQLVPFANSDFILAALGEELGLIGLFAIMMLFAILVQRGLRIATACKDNFGRLLAVGLASVFALQLFVVVGGVTKLIPMTGLTTPFMSAGGSALLANWIMIALLIRISDRTRSPELLHSPMSDTAVQSAVRSLS